MNTRRETKRDSLKIDRRNPRAKTHRLSGVGRKVSGKLVQNADGFWVVAKS